MNYGLYLSAMGLKAQQARQAVTTNNLANAQTYGFKRDLAVMQSRANAVDEDASVSQYRVPVLEDQGGGVFASAGGIDLTQGLFKYTSNSTDLALSGSGFFTVRGNDGAKALTRDGSFRINQDGVLVTVNGGRPVLDESGQPITLDPSLPIAVSRDGTISQGDTGAGGGVKLGLVDVSDFRQLRKIGGNLLVAQSPGAITASNASTEVLQNTLEESGVDPVVEMVNMMSGMRSFEANARMISLQDQTMAQLNTVGRVA